MPPKRKANESETAIASKTKRPKREDGASDTKKTVKKKKVYVVVMTDTDDPSNRSDEHTIVGLYETIKEANEVVENYFPEYFGEDRYEGLFDEYEVKTDKNGFKRVEGLYCEGNVMNVYVEMHTMKVRG